MNEDIKRIADEFGYDAKLLYEYAIYCAWDIATLYEYCKNGNIPSCIKK